MTSRDDQSEAFLNSDAVCDEFFIDIVARKLELPKEDFKLRLVLLSPATGKNENFVSVLYRAKIKIEILKTNEKKTVDVILKVLLTTIEELKKFSVFPRERFMYEDVLSSFEKIWLERAGEVVQLGPRSIKFETDPYEIIVLDDLKAANFQMLNRKVGLNLEQTKMFIDSLAKFHAASAIRYQQDGTIKPDFDRKISMPPLTEDSPFAVGFRKMYNAFSEAVRSYGDCDKYADKIDKWEFAKLLTQWVDVAEPMRNGFVILNHGDTWLNNIMFRSDDDGNPLEVNLIDFQLSYWAGPAGDLTYFLISSVHDDIKVDKFDYFVQYYHERLTEGLEKLKYDQPIPTLDELQVDFKDKASFGASLLMMLLFVVKYDSPEEINMEMMMSGGTPEMMERIYKNENYKKAIKKWLPFLDERGYLDSLVAEKVNGIAE